jgi:hypothetical protein
VLFGVVLVGLAGPGLWAADIDPGTEATASGERSGIPPGLRNSNPNMVEECGFLINERSWSSHEKFLTGDHPPGHQSAKRGRGPDPTKVFLAHLVSLFNMPTPPCP